MRLTITLQRFNPEQDAAPHDEEIRLDVRRGTTVLDLLIRIKQEVDGRLALRYSCRSAICGSCAMEINGGQKLACRTSVRQEYARHGRLRIAPLPHFPVIKDLVVDMGPFWRKIRDITPWLSSSSLADHRPAEAAGGLPEPAESRFHNVDACIMCGACVAACTVHAVSPQFAGPAALAKADRFLADPRESERVTRARLEVLQDEHGIWDCTRCNFCVEVCPKDVKPMEAIIRLRRASLDRRLPPTAGARHITAFAGLIEGQGRLNEAVMPLKVVGADGSRFRRILPLGIRMFFKGKVPNPFAHRLAGLSQIQAIFRRGRRAPLA
ncbi:MAG: succinate dehydrogenase/fumarate reductase iron-sulfur subunit [Nitrospira sp.]|jgi:succinate dehydrogenase / fumarate reductase iron-sulfur subunit|nr:succinate dehydrogenase/fumarate reductase iron-sulfur subunit [Nitrospira sp.]